MFLEPFETLSLNSKAFADEYFMQAKLKIKKLITPHGQRMQKVIFFRHHFKWHEMHVALECISKIIL